MDITFNIIGALLFGVWLFCLRDWLKKGIEIPKYIHGLALGLTGLFVGVVIGLTLTGAGSLKLGLMAVVAPLLAVYFGWFWLHGPDWQTTDAGNDHSTRS
ncbi:MAG: hypothetical protein AAF492_27440 [Verrucomicrobiota bacterium]